VYERGHVFGRGVPEAEAGEEDDERELEVVLGAATVAYVDGTVGL
jgi:hypothetical protein